MEPVNSAALYALIGALGGVLLTSLANVAMAFLRQQWDSTRAERARRETLADRLYNERRQAYIHFIVLSEEVSQTASEGARTSRRIVPRYLRRHRWWRVSSGQVTEAVLHENAAFLAKAREHERARVAVTLIASEEIAQKVRAFDAVLVRAMSQELVAGQRSDVNEHYQEIIAAMRSDLMTLLR